MSQDTLSLDEHAKRFLFRRRLGEGAFGVVWDAYDMERGARVALKALTRTEPSSLFLFKREFRALADIAHPNLVSLYELLSIGDRWFFTMELVEGHDFVEHVRGTARAEVRSAGTETVTILRTGPVLPGAMPSELTPDAFVSEGVVEVVPPVWYDQPTIESTTLAGNDMQSVSVRITMPPPPPGGWNDERGRAALTQLVEGLNALHDVGKLHRDIKPSNVLVTHDNRVVVLDFGLITELWPTGIQREQHAIVGTPAFMSPEQSLGRSLTPASDWYSVGAMLYVTLTSRLPFEGTPIQVISAKQRFDPDPPSSFSEGIPSDIEALCMDLLRRKPEDRPTGAEILKRLGATRAPFRNRSIVPYTTFVGREAHLQALDSGFEITKGGRACVTILNGASGMGKSAILQAFIRDLRLAQPDALVLCGRCFPRESVPYKALDNIIDELSVVLQQLPAGTLLALLPRGSDALIRIFPVLRQLENSVPQSETSNAIASDIELRRRAFAALRELFARITQMKPVVLILDDLQWSDADSDALLAELLRGPDGPPLFVVATFRTEDLESTPLHRTAREENVELRALAVGPLEREEARELSLQYLGSDVARAEAIARESGGNPFFIEALSDHVAVIHADDRSPDSVVRVDLKDVFREKIARLPSIARTFLETICVAGHPIAIIPAWKASGISLPEQSMLSLLRVRHLIRSRTDVGTAHEELEPYHERIREAALSNLSAEDLRDRRERIAVALEAAGETDPEVLASHFEAAGRVAEAGKYALLAAKQSEEALAFDRAARLYRWSLALGPTPNDSATRERLGDALANAGRGGEAADAYLVAARGAPSARTLDLRRKAAEQLLISGHVDKGMEVIRLVMASLGMKLPQSREAALVSFVAGRARLKLRGLRFKERSASEIPAEELLRIDACWAVAVGLSLVDNVRGYDFQGRHLLLALDAGEPYRIARALAIQVGYLAPSGPKAAKRTNDLVTQSLDLAHRIGHPHAVGLATTMAGAAHYLCGRWRDSIELLERGSRILREQCTGVTWERDTADIFFLSALMQAGRWKELSVRYDEFLRTARARGDLYAETHAMLEFGWYVSLAADAPWTAREDHEEAYRHKTGDTFDVHDFLHVLGSVGIDLYRDAPEAALATLNEKWSRLRSAFFLEFYLPRLDLLNLRARAQIGSAVRPHVSPWQRDKLLRAAEKDIAKIDGEGQLYPQGAALLLRACIAGSTGKYDVARDLAERAERAFSSADMEIQAAVARYRLGELLAGARGELLIAQAKERLSAQGVKAPDKMARFYAPGRWRD